MMRWKTASAAVVLLWTFCWVPGGAAEPADQADARPVASGAEAEATEGQEEGDEQIEFPPEIEALLNQASAAEEYGGEQEKCIQSRSIRDTRILDDRHIVFEMPGETYYLIQFKHRCPQLRRNSALIYESRANRLCRLDFIKAANGFHTGDVGPPCSIPGFIPITAEQVALLDDALQAARQR